MSLPTINLDDRRFDDLVEAAHRQIRQHCAGWTDLSAGDPGVVLLEVFAHLTEVMLFRLNRVPDKVKIELLNLLGVRLQPPAAAGAELVFSLRQPATHKVEIPRGTRVTAPRSAGSAEPPVFATAESAAIESGATEARVSAYQADRVQAELVGHGTGTPGLAVFVQHPPIVSSSAGGRKSSSPSRTRRARCRRGRMGFNLAARPFESGEKSRTFLISATMLTPI